MSHPGRVRLALTLMLLAIVVAPSALGDHSVTELVSTGGNGAFDAEYVGSSNDGTRVFFGTYEPLASADTDLQYDVYERSGGTTTLLSTGPAGGNGPYDAVFDGSSADGKHVFLTTQEQLTSSDGDNTTDVYDRSGATTSLLSTGPVGGNGAYDAVFDAASADGSRVILSTREKLTADDDTPLDIYERAGGTTTLLTGGHLTALTDDSDFNAASTDARHVFFTTRQRLDPADDDFDYYDDVYERFAGTTKLVSTGPGDSQDSGRFEGASGDGLHAYFSTGASFASEDVDGGAWDLYERTAGTTRLVSTGPAEQGVGTASATFRAASDAGSRVFFSTGGALVNQDTDSCSVFDPHVCDDVYERANGSTSLVSTGPSAASGPFPSIYAGSSSDGGRVFFATAERMTGADTDSSSDVYERSSGSTALLSTGPAGGNGPSVVSFEDASGDGTRVFFSTDERLVGSDTDSSFDVYERSGGVTTLISSGSGQQEAFFAGSSADGTRAFYETAEPLTGSDTDASQDVYSSRVRSTYVRPKGATPIWVSLVPASRECASGANRTHTGGIVRPSCNPSATVSGNLTTGTPDANGNPVKMTAQLRVDVLPDKSSTAQDDADGQLVILINDVRKKADASDYTGELSVVLTLRVTDRASGSAPVDAATGVDVAFPVRLSCTPTPADATVGSSCEATTTVNTVQPGAISTGNRAIWELGQVKVLDGGPDGLVSTAPNDLFLVQGVFSP